MLALSCWLRRCAHLKVNAAVHSYSENVIDIDDDDDADDADDDSDCDEIKYEWHPKRVFFDYKLFFQFVFLFCVFWSVALGSRALVRHFYVRCGWRNRHRHRSPRLIFQYTRTIRSERRCFAQTETFPTPSIRAIIEYNEPGPCVSEIRNMLIGWANRDRIAPVFGSCRAIIMSCGPVQTMQSGEKKKKHEWMTLSIVIHIAAISLSRFIVAKCALHHFDYLVFGRLFARIVSRVMFASPRPTRSISTVWVIRLTDDRAYTWACDSRFEHEFKVNVARIFFYVWK